MAAMTVTTAAAVTAAAVVTAAVAATINHARRNLLQPRIGPILARCKTHLIGISKPMKPKARLFGVMTAACLLAAPAFASDLVDTVLADLKAQGYANFQINKTWLGRTQIRATSPKMRREIVINPGTGEILRDYWETLDTGKSGNPSGNVLDDNKPSTTSSKPGDDDDDDSSSGKSGSGGSGSGGSGSNNDDSSDDD
jgi:hypothetical protein